MIELAVWERHISLIFCSKLWNYLTIFSIWNKIHVPIKENLVTNYRSFLLISRGLVLVINEMKSSTAESINLYCKLKKKPRKSGGVKGDERKPTLMLVPPIKNLKCFRWMILLVVSELKNIRKKMPLDRTNTLWIFNISSSMHKLSNLPWSQ